MAFAYSRIPLAQMRHEKFKGDWKYLDRAIFELPEANANRAVLELAVLLRSVDDDWDLSAQIKRDFGTLYGVDGTTSALTLRDVPNKIIHANKLEWATSDPADPRLVCHAHPNQQERFKWVRATISIFSLATACGMFLG